MLQTRQFIRNVFYAYLLFYGRAFVMSSSGNGECDDEQALAEERRDYFSRIQKETEQYRDKDAVDTPIGKDDIAEQIEQLEDYFHKDPEEALRTVVWEDQGPLLEAFIELRLITIDVRLQDGKSLWESLLIYSAMRSARVLIRNGLDVNDRSLLRTAENALKIVFYSKNLEMLGLLIDAGVDVSSLDSESYTPLQEVCAIIYDKEDKEGGQLIAEMARKLIDAGAEIDVQHSFRGETPLILAITRNNPVLIRLLLEKGANVNLSLQKTGDTPLLLAAFDGSLEIGRLLLDYGADVHVRDEKGYTAFSLAKYLGNNAFADMLRRHEEEKGRQQEAAENRFSFLKLGATVLGVTLISGIVYRIQQNRERKRKQEIARALKKDKLDELTENLFKRKWEDKKDGFFYLFLDFPQDISENVCEISIDTFFCEDERSPYFKLQEEKVKTISVKKQILIDEVKQSLGRLFGNSNVSIIEDSSKTKSNTSLKSIKLFIETGIDGFDKNKKKEIKTKKISLLEKIIQHSSEYKKLEEQDAFKQQQENFREKISSTEKEIQGLRDELNTLRKNKPDGFARFENRALSVLALLKGMKNLSREEARVKQNANAILSTVGSDAREKIIKGCEEKLSDLGQDLKLFSNNLKRQAIQKNSCSIDEKINVVKRKTLDLGGPVSTKREELKRQEKFLKIWEEKRKKDGTIKKEPALPKKGSEEQKEAVKEEKDSEKKSEEKEEDTTMSPALDVSKWDHLLRGKSKPDKRHFESEGRRKEQQGEEEEEDKERDKKYGKDGDKYPQRSFFFDDASQDVRTIKLKAILIGDILKRHDTQAHSNSAIVPFALLYHTLRFSVFVLENYKFEDETIINVVSNIRNFIMHHKEFIKLETLINFAKFFEKQVTPALQNLQEKNSKKNRNAFRENLEKIKSTDLYSAVMKEEQGRLNSEDYVLKIEMLLKELKNLRIAQDMEFIKVPPDQLDAAKMVLCLIGESVQQLHIISKHEKTEEAEKQITKKLLTHLYGNTCVKNLFKFCMPARKNIGHEAKDESTSPEFFWTRDEVNEKAIFDLLKNTEKLLAEMRTSLESFSNEKTVENDNLHSDSFGC